jgi:hypothetical protein
VPCAAVLAPEHSQVSCPPELHARWLNMCAASAAAVLTLQHCTWAMEQGTAQHARRLKPRAWCLYFGDTGYSSDDRRALLIHDLVSFFEEDSTGWRLLMQLQSQEERCA